MFLSRKAAPRVVLGVSRTNKTRDFISILFNLEMLFKGLEALGKLNVAVLLLQRRNDFDAVLNASHSLTRMVGARLYVYVYLMPYASYLHVS